MITSGATNYRKGSSIDLFHNINHCREACLRRWTNNLPDFYFVCVCDKIEQQCELFLPGSLKNEEIFMEFLFGIRRVVENML